MSSKITFSTEIMGDLSTRILAHLGTGVSREQMITDIILTIQKSTEMESVGLRLANGPDFPYYFTQGFDHDFVEKEMHLCARDQLGELIRDSDGNPIIECMCGNVICGRTDPALPFFTDGGSFWSNCTSEMLACASEKELQSRTRNHCNGEGYESVALIPVKNGDKCLGLLQLNDRRKNMFSEDEICFFEGVAVNIGLLFSMSMMTEQLASQAADVTRSTIVRGELLARLAKELCSKDDLELTSERKENLLAKIENLLEEVSLLKGIIPICSVCKKVRVDSNYWTQVEAFVRDRSNAEFSHTYCPECYSKILKEEDI